MKSHIAIILLSLICWFVQPASATEPLDVSLIQLIANPKDFDGKIVRLIGFVKLEFEGNAIYFHQDDYKFGISKNALWLDITEDIRKKQAHFDERYIILEGTFNAENTGHMGMFSGSIQKISRFQVWSDKNGRK
jgi:hypothetical protein